MAASGTLHKHNYIEFVQSLVPNIYLEREETAHGTKQDSIYSVLNSVLQLGVSADLWVTGFGPGRSYKNPDICKFFVPSNKLTRVTADVLDTSVLPAFGERMENFKTKKEWETFVTDTLLPSISYNNFTPTFSAGCESFIASSLSSSDLVQNHLEDSLGLLYFVNSKGRSSVAINESIGASALSSCASALWVDNIYKGQPITEDDCVQSLLQYTWGAQNSDNTEKLKELIPYEYRVSATAADVSSTSGTVAGFKAAASVFMHPKQKSPIVEDSLSIILSSTLYPTKIAPAGNLRKFLQAMSFTFYDVDEVISELNEIIDIHKAPPEFVEHLATLIGWKLVGEDVESWRAQLRNAIYLYKTKGTREGLESFMSLFFVSGTYFPLSSTNTLADSTRKGGLYELWESYLPNLIYYTLKTESFMVSATDTEREQFVRHLKDYTQLNVNVDKEVPDNNFRFLTDLILEALHKKHGCIRIQNRDYRETKFWQSQETVSGKKGFLHRGKTVVVPPWEDEKFYSDSYITPEVLETLNEILISPRQELGFEVPSSTVSDLSSYIGTKTGMDGDSIPEVYGDNHRFRFYTYDHEYPPNLSANTNNAGFEPGSILADYWNSKSSNLAMHIPWGDVEFFRSDGMTTKSTPATVNDTTTFNTYSLDIITECFREMMPLRTMVRSIVRADTMDDAQTYQEWGCGFIHGRFEEPPEGLLDSTYSTGFRGGQGSASGVRQSKGRHVSDPEGDFWTTTGTLGYRTNTRARSLKYNLPSSYFSREGLNQPLSPDFNDRVTWGSGVGAYAFSAGISDYLFSSMRTNSFMPKGYNFSSLSYFSPKVGEASGIYSKHERIKAGMATYLDPSSMFYGIQASAVYPARSRMDLPLDCSSSGPFNRMQVKEINRAMMGYAIRKYKITQNATWLNFDGDLWEQRGFGTKVNTAWLDYRHNFEKTLDFQPFSLLSHGFGPGHRNPDFEISGTLNLTDNDSLAPFIPPRAPNFAATISESPEWKAFVCGDALEGTEFKNYENTNKILRRNGLLSKGGYGTYQNPSDMVGNPIDTGGMIKYSNNANLSGVEFVGATHSTNMAILNTTQSNNYRLISQASGATLFETQRNTPWSYNGGSVRIRIPYNRNHNYLINNEFQNAPDENATNVATAPDTSSVLGWKLIDYTRRPSAFTAGDGTGIVTMEEDKSTFPWTKNLLFTTAGSDIKNANSAHVETVLNTYNGKHFQNPLPGVSPNTWYDLKWDCSSSDSANTKIKFSLWNQTSSLTLDGAGSWVASSTPILHETSALGSVSSIIYTFKTPSHARPSDSYVFKFGPSVTAAVTNTKVSKVYLREKYANRLLPNRDYKLEIIALNRMPNYAALGVDIHTGKYSYGIPRKNFSLGDMGSWMYHRGTKRWEKEGVGDLGTPDRSSFLKHLPPSQGNPNKHDSVVELLFHTYNNLGPLENGRPMPGRHSRIHNDETEYFFDIYMGPSTPQTALQKNHIEILRVSLIDLTLNSKFDDYNRGESKSIMTFFDEQVVGRNSRDSSYSNSSMGASGGHRGEYLEMHGGYRFVTDVSGAGAGAFNGKQTEIYELGN